MSNLCTLVIITNTESTLGADSVGPETTEINTSLWELSMGKEKPEAKDWLGEDVKNSVGQDFLVDAEEAGAISYTPNDWVRGPDEDGIERDGSEEFANLTRLSLGLRTSIDNKVPDDDKEAKDSNCVPAPLLALRLTVGSKQSSQDHDDVGKDCNEDMSAIETSEDGKIEEKERSG